MSEATTRVFEATRERAASPTEAWNSQPTGPAYIAPAAASPLQDSASTRSLDPVAPQRPQKNRLVLSFALLFAAVLFAFALGMWLSSRRATGGPTQTPPPVVTRPGTDIPQPPPPPPPPVAQPPAPGTSVPTAELMYPGAETVMDMQNGRDNFLQLRSADASDKVVDWYADKLKGAQIIRQPRAGAVLRAGATQVIISPGGGQTEIIIKQGAER